MNSYFKTQILIFIMTMHSIGVSGKAKECPDTFKKYWTDFRKAIEKDRMKDMIYLSQFPLILSYADGKETQEWGPKSFKGNIYKILSEKCDVMENKNQKQWILKYKELPDKTPFLTCTKNWVQFCNFDFNYSNSIWRLSKINTTQKSFFKNPPKVK